MRTRYRIAVTDALDVVSSYTVSNTIQRMSTPEMPIVSAPVNGSVIHNTTPRFLIKTGGTPDGRVQKVCVKIGTSAWKNSVSNPERFSVSGNLSNGVSTIYQAESLSGEIALTIRCENDAGASVSVTRNFTVAPLPIETISAGVTIVKASHMQTLRNAANNNRHYYGLSPAVWQDTIFQHRTMIRDWPVHIKEVRAALEEVAVRINSHDTVSKFDVTVPNWLPISAGRPQAAVIQQLTELIQSL